MLKNNRNHLEDVLAAFCVYEGDSVLTGGHGLECV